MTRYSSATIHFRPLSLALLNALTSASLVRMVLLKLLLLFILLFLCRWLVIIIDYC